MLSNNDWIELQRLKWKRFEALFQADDVSLNWQGHDGKLIIDCPNGAVANSLMSRIAALCALAWIVLGVNDLAIYLAEESIWEGLTKSALSLESTDFIDFEDLEMATATAEQPLVAVQSVVQEAIAPAIDQAIDQELQAITANGTLEKMVRERVSARLRNLLQTISPASNGTATAEPPAPISEPTTAETNGAAPFKVAGYNATLANALRHWLPDDKARLAMLTQIRRGSQKGKAFVSEQVASFYPAAKRGSAIAAMTKPSTLDKVKAQFSSK